MNATSPLRQCVDTFGDKRVLVVGDAVLDEYLFGSCSRISPEAPVPVLNIDRKTTVLGCAANTASNVASLGGRATLITLVGEDDAGRELLRCAEAQGVEVRALADGRPTLRKTRVVGNHQQVVRLDYEDAAPIGAAVEEEAFARFTTHAADSDVIVVSDYAKGLVSPGLCRAIIRHAAGIGRPVVIDPRPQHRDRYGRCTYITPNWREACGILGIPDEQVSPEAVSRISCDVARLLHTNVLLTLGPGGMYFCSSDGHERFALPTFAKEVFDVSGAGDTVVAAFALAVAAGAGHRLACDIANRAAGAAVAKFGTATVSREELFTDEDRPRLLRRDALREVGTALRAAGKKVVTINGSFDMLHAGHLYILEQARNQGDVLIVGLNSDRSVAAYKGPSRPVIPEQRRAQMLLALRVVDYVHVFDEDTPVAFIDEIRPDVHVNGAEYGEDCIEAPTVRRHGGKVHIVERLPGLSSSDVIDAIRAGASLGA